MCTKMSDEDVKAVVIDLGSGSIKAGFSGGKTVRAVLPSLVGRPRNKDALVGTPKDSYVGDEAQRLRSILNLRRPIERGTVTNWEDMESLMKHTYQELRTAPEKHPVLLTEPPIHLEPHREQMAQLMFEGLSAPAMFMADPAVLAVLASGRTTGVILDSGYGFTRILPIYEGRPQLNACDLFELGGSDLTECLRKLLDERGYRFNNLESSEIACQVKEELCDVALNFQDVTNTDSLENNKDYELPDGEIMKVGRERFLCPEALFQPSLLGLQYPGIHEAVHNSIMKCDQTMHQDLYLNIILSGGNTMHRNINSRLHLEISRLAPDIKKHRVAAPPERKKSVWIGGSILSGLDLFENMWITKQEYEEFGPVIFNRKTLDLLSFC